MTGVVEYFRISEGTPLPSVEAYAPFRAVIVSTSTATTDWRTHVSRWLVGSGCLYMMAWGTDADEWHLAVDWANIDAFDPEPVPEEHHVMTTSHEESLDEVFWFARFCANSPSGEIAATLIIDVSDAARRDEMLQRFAAAALE